MGSQGHGFMMLSCAIILLMGAVGEPSPFLMGQRIVARECAQMVARTIHVMHACVRACMRARVRACASARVHICVCMSVSACAWSAPVPTTVLPSGCVCTDLGFR